jgi:hypothetical protein
MCFCPPREQLCNRSCSNKHTHTPVKKTHRVGSRSPAIPRWAGGWACTSHPSPVRDGQTSPHMLRLVVSDSACPSLSPSPPAHSFIIGAAVINKHPEVLDSIPKREESEPGKPGRHPVLCTGFLTGPTHPHANTFVLGTAVIHTHTHTRSARGWGCGVRTVF